MGRAVQTAGGANPSVRHSGDGVKKTSTKSPKSTQSLKRRARMDKKHSGDQGVMGGDIRRGPLIRLLQMVHGGDASADVRPVIRRHIGINVSRILTSAMAIAEFRRKKTVTAEMVRCASEYHGTHLLTEDV